MSDSGSTGLHASILAAGGSTRFGSPKQLVRIAGAPVLHEVVASAAAIAGHSVTVVLGAHAQEIAMVLRQSTASVALNRDWEEGISSSIRRAVQSAPPGSEALMLVAAALYDGAPGLPAIFPRWTFSDLMELRGDVEPRLVLRRNIDRLVRVPMQNAAIDLDTPEDLLELEAGLAERRPS